MIRLEARAIEVRAGTRSIVKDVTLSLAAGEFVALIGPNGAGKSTLLCALAGDCPLEAGEIRLCSRPLSEWSKAKLAQRRAMLPQHCSVAFDFAVRQVAALGLLTQHGRLSETRQRTIVDRALAETGTLAFADRPYFQLSRGERQRVQLARVLAQCDANEVARPVLMLDEPIAGLDLAHQHAALASARRRASRGYAVLAVLHDLGMAARYADRVAILENGRLVAIGPPRETLDPALLSRVFATPIVRFETIGTMAFVSPGESC